MAFRFNREKFRNLILYIAEQSRDDPKFGATKLNKILYFSDFEAYGLWGEPITGATYFRLKRGPAPREIMPVIKEMEGEGMIRRSERQYFHLTQKRIEALQGPDRSLFSDRELDLVDKVISELDRFNASEVSALSHLDDGWQMADDRAVIPYSSVYISSLSVVASRGATTGKAWSLALDNPGAQGKITRRSNLRRKFALTPEEADQMELEQGGLCAICHRVPTNQRHNGKLYIDHDHQTGRVRAMLCSRCNTSIGQFEDNPDLLRAAATYLEHHQSRRSTALSTV